MTCCDDSLNKNTSKRVMRSVSNKKSDNKMKSKSKKKKIITSKKRISVNFPS